jgi:hypothetical protein
VEMASSMTRAARHLKHLDLGGEERKVLLASLQALQDRFRSSGRTHNRGGGLRLPYCPSLT